MLPTPSTDHVSFDRIYEPAEDSYLLLDTLSSENEKLFLRNHFNGPRSGAKWKDSQQREGHGPSPFVVEIGTGSGVVLAFVTAHCQSILGRSDVQTLGVDINRHACLATQETVTLASRNTSQQHAVFLDNINGDLTTALRPNQVDLLIFNPPYVPTEDLPENVRETQSLQSAFEEDSHLLALSYAGGQDGMEVTNRLLGQLPIILNDRRGVAYILLCAQNKPDLVKADITSWGAEWSAETVGSSGKKAGWEKLQILRITRSPNTLQPYAFSVSTQPSHDRPCKPLDLAATNQFLVPI